MKPWLHPLRLPHRRARVPPGTRESRDPVATQLVENADQLTSYYKSAISEHMSSSQRLWNCPYVNAAEYVW